MVYYLSPTATVAASSPAQATFDPAATVAASLLGAGGVRSAGVAELVYSNPDPSFPSAHKEIEMARQSAKFRLALPAAGLLLSALVAAPQEAAQSR